MFTLYASLTFTKQLASEFVVLPHVVKGLLCCTMRQPAAANPALFGVTRMDDMHRNDEIILHSGALMIRIAATSRRITKCPDTTFSLNATASNLHNSRSICDDTGGRSAGSADPEVSLPVLTAVKPADEEDSTKISITAQCKAVSKTNKILILTSAKRLYIGGGTASAVTRSSGGRASGQARLKDHGVC